MENPTSFARSVKKSRNYSFGAICREQFFLLLICVLFAGKGLTQGQIAEDKLFIPAVVMVPDSDEHIGAHALVLPAQLERNESFLFATQRKIIPPKSLQSEGRIDSVRSRKG